MTFYVPFLLFGIPTSAALQVLIALVPGARYALHASLFKDDQGIALRALTGVKNLFHVSVAVTISIGDNLWREFQLDITGFSGLFASAPADRVAFQR